jgi:hypothetical protein
VQASVSRGEYSEKVLDTFSDFGEYTYGSSIVLSPPWEEGKNFTITQKWLEAVFYNFLFGEVDPLGGQLMGSVITHDSNQGIRVQDIPAFGASSRQNDALQAVFYVDFNGTTCPTPDDNVACAFRALGAAMTKSVRDVCRAEERDGGTVVAEGRSILWGRIYVSIGPGLHYRLRSGF